MVHHPRSSSEWTLGDPPELWRNIPGRTYLRSVHACETGSSEIVGAPGDAAGLDDLHSRPFQCWNASCRRCGPIVGRADFVRLSEAITKGRWIYLVITVPEGGGNVLERVKRRRARAWSAWRRKARAMGIEAEPLEAPTESCSLFEALQWQAHKRTEFVRRATRATLAKCPPPDFSESRYSGNLYHAASHLWRRDLKPKLEREWGRFSFVLTWEKTRRGVPHLNVLIDAGAAWRLIDRTGGWRWQAARGSSRRCRFSKALRDELQQWVHAVGFGQRFWVEVCHPEDDALAGYVSKLAMEMTCAQAKGQSPTNRPRGFNRYSASAGLLNPRWYPKGQPSPCPEEDCTSEPPPGGWCTRTIVPHLRREHGWTLSDARSYRDSCREEHASARAHGMVVKTQGLDAAARLEAIAHKFQETATEDEGKKRHATALAAMLRDEAAQARSEADGEGNEPAAAHLHRVREGAAT